eukprot:gene12258-biopygen4779
MECAHQLCSGKWSAHTNCAASNGVRTPTVQQSMECAHQLCSGKWSAHTNCAAGNGVRTPTVQPAMECADQLCSRQWKTNWDFHLAVDAGRRLLFGSGQSAPGKLHVPAGVAGGAAEGVGNALLPGLRY